MKNKNLLLPCKVVMLPTQNASHLTIRTKTNELMYSYKLFANNGKELNVNQFLYFVSQTKIKKAGDFYIVDNRVEQVPPGCFNEQPDCLKIESTTDSVILEKTFGFPQIGESFLEAFEKSKGTITEVQLEMNEVVISESVDNYDDNDIWVNGEKKFSSDHRDEDRIQKEADKYRGGVRTREDNTVITHRAKQFSADEVEAIVVEIFHQVHNGEIMADKSRYYDFDLSPRAWMTKNKVITF